MPRSAILISLALLPLTACASGDYPSLARRDAERVSGSAAPVTPDAAASPEALPPSAGLAQRLASLVAQAAAAHNRFTSARPGTESAVSRAAGAPVASDGWSVATVALAGLESSRSDAMVALAELDALYAADRLAHVDRPSGDAAGIAQARDQVTGIIAEEDRVLAALRGRIRG